LLLRLRCVYVYRLRSLRCVVRLFYGVPFVWLVTFDLVVLRYGFRLFRLRFTFVHVRSLRSGFGYVCTLALRSLHVDALRYFVVRWVALFHVTVARSRYLAFTRCRCCSTLLRCLPTFVVVAVIPVVVAFVYVPARSCYVFTVVV